MNTLTKAPSFQSVVEAVEAADKLNFDLTTSLSDLHMGPDGLVFDRRNDRTLGFTDLGLGQFARKLGIPAPYVSKLANGVDEQGTAVNTELLAENVNYWLTNTVEADPNKDLLFRCVSQGKGKRSLIRAVLTDKYGIMDNAPSLHALIAAFESIGLDDLSIEGYSLTPSSFHLRLSDKRHAIDASKAAGHSRFIPKGEDFLFPMLHNFNSEVGTKSYGLDGGIYRVVCTNGLVKPLGGDEMGFKKRHFGYTTEELTKFVFESAERILSSASEFAQKFAQAQNVPVEQAETVIKNLFGRARVSRRDERAVLQELANQFEGMDLNLAPVTQYDVVNAITATARELPADERVTLERIAATVIA